jgi:polyisoprenoid-binding protein YceI
MALEKWNFDVARSSVGFTVRHLVVSKVHGRFKSWRGALSFDEANLAASSVEVEIDVTSIETGDALRDDYLRTGDALEPAKYPSMTFKSTSVTAGKSRFEVAGDLTVRGVTRPVTLDVDRSGKTRDAVHFSARASLNRKDFGVSFNAVLDAGGVAVSEKVDVVIELEATRVG